MAPGSRAIIYDAMAAGRVGRGERWQFRSVRSEMAITHDGRPLYLSRTLITPASQPLNQLGWMEDANYLGNDDRRGTMRRRIGAVWSVLSIRRCRRIQGVHGGASAMARGRMRCALHQPHRRWPESRSALKLWANRAAGNRSDVRHFPLRKL